MIKTARLLLRPCQSDDAAPLALPHPYTTEDANSFNAKTLNCTSGGMTFAGSIGTMGALGYWLEQSFSDYAHRLRAVTKPAWEATQ